MQMMNTYQRIVAGRGLRSSFGLRLEANRSKSTMYDLNQPGVQAAPHELLEVGLHLRKLMMLGASLARWPDPCLDGRYIDKVYYVQGCS